MFEGMTEGMERMFGKVAPGMCRLSMSGGIAVKTSTGYKSYNIKKRRLTNCNNFVFNIGEEFFFLVPTNNVTVGDIILINGKPKCCIDNTDNKTITVINYEDSTVETILPERHIFMGNTYFYGKIVLMFGNNKLNSSNGMNKMMTYMMMSEMMKGSAGTTGNSNMSSMLPFMMMNNGNVTDMFDGLFNFDSDMTNEEDEEVEE